MLELTFSTGLYAEGIEHVAFRIRIPYEGYPAHDVVAHVMSCHVKLIYGCKVGQRCRMPEENQL